MKGLRHQITKLKRALKHMSNESCKNCLYKQIIHLLNHVSCGLQRYGSLRFLYASTLERLNVPIKPAKSSISQRQSSGMVETVGVMDTEWQEGLKRIEDMYSV